MFSPLDDDAKVKVIDAYTDLLKHPIPAHLDLHPIGPPQSGVYSIRVAGTLRISFKEIEGIAELRSIASDEMLDSEGYLSD
jgi:hypothetical protein